MRKYLYFDIETYSAGKAMWDMPPQEFIRLFQYAWNDGEVKTTTNYEEMISLLEQADYLVGHNIHAFDLSVLYGKDSIRPLELAQQRKVIDTMILTHLVKPVPYSYTNREGHTFYDAASPGQAMKYYSLDNLCYQFKLPGKMGNLQELAKKHNPPKTLVRDLEYGLIPLDDPEFIEYAEQDIVAVRGLFQYLIRVQQKLEYDSDYLWREQELAAVLAQISRNGIRIDVDRAKEKVAQQEERRDSIMNWLVENYDFPTTGKQPWKSAAGKEAILKAFASYGITPKHPLWIKTPKGAPSFSGDVLKEVSQGTEAEELGEALAELLGQRSMAQLALDSVTADGRAHPNITMFQRSGRFSFTNPGITIYDQENKDVFLADEGTVCVELDFSNADARAVAAVSGDRNFAKRFETDENGKDLYDGHNLSGEAFFGKDMYWSQLADDGKPLLRPVAKASTHAIGYNIGPKKLAVTLNTVARKMNLGREFGEDEARSIIDAYHRDYPRIAQWKWEVIAEGDQYGYVTNDWGRRMSIDTHVWNPYRQEYGSRSYNQSPSLIGQSTTRECMSDAILKLARKGEKWARSIRGVIHDALVVDLPEETVEEDVKVVVECMETVFRPKRRGSIAIPFPVGVGSLTAKNWKEGAH